MRRRSGSLRSIAAATAIWALVGCGGAEDEDASGSAFEDDFSDPSSGWPTADDQLVLLEYSDGGYRVVLRDPSRPHASWFQVSEDAQALTVEADASLRDDPGGSESRESWGIACSSVRLDGRSLPGETSYFFHVTSDGLWAIGREDSESGAEEFIESGDGGIEHPAEAHRLKAECVAHGDGRTTLAFAVDGKELARTTDPEGPPRFTTIALHVRADDANTEVFFDNVSVGGGA